MELRIQAVSPMGEERRVRTDFQCLVRRAGFRIRDDRRHYHPRSSARHGGKRGSCHQAIGRSRGGLTTKIVALVDALGNLARFVLLPGQRHDSIAPDLIEGIDMEALLADKGFDNNRLRELLQGTETQAFIPPKADRKDLIPCDFAMYRWRHLAENSEASQRVMKR